MKKAVITILGLAGGKVEKKEDQLILTNFKTKHEYYFKEDEKNNNYTNTLPLLIDKYDEEYVIIPIFTKEAKCLQTKLLQENHNKDISSLFTDDYYIKDENDFQDILKIINKVLLNNSYDKFIIDLTHGFRHLPILATINLIMHNIKNKEKIEHIWFAKEIVKPDKDTKGTYHIIDLQEYLDLANLSFIITNFKDNYTTSKHIQVKDKKYQELLSNMNKFSSDLMALSLEHLFDKSQINLSNSIEKLLLDETTILKDSLEELKIHINNIFTKKAHRYETYYNLATDLSFKGYLAISLSLIFEGTAFYIKSSFKNFSDDLKKTIDDIEIKIKNKEPLHDKTRKAATYYDITSACKSYITHPEREVKKDGKIIQKSNNDQLFKEHRDLIYKKLNMISGFEDFKKFVNDTSIMRNNLLHSNSGDKVSFIDTGIGSVLNNCKKFCIDDDILNIQPKIPKITNEGMEQKTNKKQNYTTDKNGAKCFQKKEQSKQDKENLHKLGDMLNSKFN